MATYTSTGQGGTTYQDMGDGTYLFTDLYGRTISNITYNGLPDDVKSQVPAPTAPVPILQTSDSINGTATSGSTGPGPDSILVTPTQTLVTSGDASTATKTYDVGTQKGDYTTVYGPKTPSYTSTSQPLTTRRVTTNEEDAAAAAARNGTSPTSAANGYSTAGLPTVNLTPGTRSNDVKALQSWLINNGFNIPDGATGYYGPQTLAAVTALQQKLGVDVAGNPGYYGPRTRSALQNQVSGIGDQSNSPAATTTSNTNSAVDAGRAFLASQGITAPSPDTSPVVQFADVYSQMLEKLGIPTIKDQVDQYQKQFADVQNELNDKIADVNENPWLTEGIRVAQINKLKERYATRLDTLSNQQQLYESLYEKGIAQAEYVTNGYMQQIKDQTDFSQELLLKAIDIANKQTTAKYQEVSPGATLFDPATGRAIYTAPTTKSLNPTTTTGGSNPGGKIVSGTLTYTVQDRAEDSQALEASRGTDHWVDPSVYLRLYNNWIAAGGTQKGFLSTFPPKNYVNPANTWLPDFLKNTTASSSTTSTPTNPFR